MSELKPDCIACEQCGAIIRVEDAWIDEFLEHLLCDDCWLLEQQRIWYDPQDNQEPTE